MKISSSTHLTILVTFALIFVVIYLYYTITDVRKMSVELKKVTQDVQTLSSSFAKVSNDLIEVQKMGLDVSKMFNMNDMLTHELNGLLSQQIGVTQPIQMSCNAEVCTQVEQTALDVDDTESVDTADIKKILNDDDATDEIISEQVQEPVKPAPKKSAPKKKST